VSRFPDKWQGKGAIPGQNPAYRNISAWLPLALLPMEEGGGGEGKSNSQIIFARLGERIRFFCRISGYGL